MSSYQLVAASIVHGAGVDAVTHFSISHEASFTHTLVLQKHPVKSENKGGGVINDDFRVLKSSAAEKDSRCQVRRVYSVRWDCNLLGCPADNCSVPDTPGHRLSIPQHTHTKHCLDPQRHTLPVKAEREGGEQRSKAELLREGVGL